MSSVILWLVPVIAFAGILICVWVVKQKIQNFSRSVFGTDSLTEGLERQADELAMTPKSVSGMTRIFAPQIQRDFPDFHLEEFRDKVENVLVAALQAIGAGASFSGSFTGLENADDVAKLSEDFKLQVKNRIAINETAGITEHYEQITVYQTEITNYSRQQGKCMITFQSAVGHFHYKEKDGVVTEGDKKRLEQTKYNVELMYIQDETLVGEGNAFGTTCPNCGAPVTRLGAMYCEYCGSAVTPVNVKVWSVHSFYEVDYRHV
ncbi:MAG: zinc-ribbon domain-containing protein [Clostridiales bacterium]|nr:zinc-ribbon domain-containing protein [Clostridiales bacterium]